MEFMLNMDNQGIDLVKYGALWQKVENYEAKFDEMSKKIDKMEASVEEPSPEPNVVPIAANRSA